MMSDWMLLQKSRSKPFLGLTLLYPGDEGMVFFLAVFSLRELPAIIGDKNRGCRIFYETHLLRH